MTNNQPQAPSVNLPTYEERRQKFIKTGWWVSIPLSFVPSHWLYDGERRLDGGFYAQDVITSNRFIHDCGYETKPLKDIVSEIFILGRFKRIYTSDSKKGWPYLSPSEAFNFRPLSEKFIAPDHAPQGAERYFSKEGWILISASGSVGRVLYTTKRLEKHFLTHDLIRVVPKDDFPIGYIYAYLSTWIGQALMIKDQYGAAIKHLEPHHISKVLIPIIPTQEQLNIHNKIIECYELRERANELIDEALSLVYSRLGLKNFNNDDVLYLTHSDKAQKTDAMPNPQTFSISSSTLQNRFDASFHIPSARTAIKYLQESSFPPIQLGKMAGNIFVAGRFKRIFVKKEYGTPFLQGSHIPMMKPQDLKYLSKTKQENIERWSIEKDMVLVTCSGTIGKIGVVSKYLNGWAASQHILRIVPDFSKGHPGYIAAILMSQYGQLQLQSKIYGGVVDELTENDTREIYLPNAPMEIQKEIGELITKAFELKDYASKLEFDAIELLEKKLS